MVPDFFFWFHTNEKQTLAPTIVSGIVLPISNKEYVP